MVRDPAAEDAIAERIRQTSERLVAEFGSRVTPQVVQQITQESLERYKAAPVIEFVPLLVERFTRERLIATLQSQT